MHDSEIENVMSSFKDKIENFQEKNVCFKSTSFCIEQYAIIQSFNPNHNKCEITEHPEYRSSRIALQKKCFLANYT